MSIQIGLVAKFYNIPLTLESDDPKTPASWGGLIKTINGGLIFDDGSHSTPVEGSFNNQAQVFLNSDPRSYIPIGLYYPTHPYMTAMEATGYISIFNPDDYYFAFDNVPHGQTITIDGVDLDFGGTNGWGTSNAERSISLTAGSHTITLKWYNLGGGPFNFNFKWKKGSSGSYSYNWTGLAYSYKQDIPSKLPYRLDFQPSGYSRNGKIWANSYNNAVFDFLNISNIDASGYDISDVVDQINNNGTKEVVLIFLDSQGNPQNITIKSAKLYFRQSHYDYYEIKGSYLSEGAGYIRDSDPIIFSWDVSGYNGGVNPVDPVKGPKGDKGDRGARGRSIKWKGEWKYNKHYKKNDIVTYDNSLYLRGNRWSRIIKGPKENTVNYNWVVIVLLIIVIIFLLPLINKRITQKRNR